MGLSNADTAIALENEHGRIASIEVDGVLHAFRAPTLEEWEDSQEGLSKGKRRGPAFRELAQVTCVTDVDALKKAFSRRPALPALLADAITELAGGTLEVTVKKG